MGKGKPRHDPDKRQNKMGDWCGFCEAIPTPDGGIHLHCELNYDACTDICKGNPHKCKKARYADAARRSDKRKNIDETY